MGIPLTVPFDLSNANPLDSRLISLSTEARDAISFRYRGMWHWTVGQGMFYVGDDFQFRPLSFLIGSLINEVLPDMVTEAVEAYLLANPISISPEALASGIEAYLLANPVTAEVDPEQLSTAIEQYFIDNPIDGEDGASAVPLVSKTYDQLMDLINTQALVAGQHYLLTDFVPTWNVNYVTGQIPTVIGEVEPLILLAKNNQELADRGISALNQDIIEFNPYASQAIYEYELDGETITSTTSSKGKITFRHELGSNIKANFDWRIAKHARYKLGDIIKPFDMADNAVASQLSFDWDILGDFDVSGSGYPVRTLLIPSFDKSNITTLVNAQGFTATVKDLTGSNVPVDLLTGNWYMVHIIVTNFTGMGSGYAIIFDMQNLKSLLENNYIFTDANDDYALAGIHFQAHATDYQLFDTFVNGAVNVEIDNAPNENPNFVFKGYTDTVKLSSDCNNITVNSNCTNLIVTGNADKVVLGTITNVTITGSAINVLFAQGWDNVIVGGRINGMFGDLMYHVTLPTSELRDNFINYLEFSIGKRMKNCTIIGGHHIDFGDRVEGLILPSSTNHFTILARLHDVMFHTSNSYITILTPVWNKCFKSITENADYIWSPLYSTQADKPRLISLTSPDGTVYEQVISNAGVITSLVATEV